MASSPPSLKKLKKNTDTTIAGTEGNSILKTDRLSKLPSEIVREIISRLEVKEAIKTSVLSKKYQFLWREITRIRMFQDSFVRYNTLVGLLVAPKISEFQMTFELQRPTLVMPQEDFTLNKWVGLLNSKHVEHLCVIKTHDGGLRMSSFPHSTYRIATLVSLTLAWPTKMTLPKDIYLPSLKTLEHVIEQYKKWGKLSTLIKSCPRLEDLILKVFVSKDTKHEVWKLGCCNQHLKTMHMSGSVDNVSSRKKIILTLEVPSLERIVIHLNRNYKLCGRLPQKS